MNKLYQIIILYVSYSSNNKQLDYENNNSLLLFIMTIDKRRRSKGVLPSYNNNIVYDKKYIYNWEILPRLICTSIYILFWHVYIMHLVYLGPTRGKRLVEK